MKPLVYALAGAGVLVALAAGPVLGQGRPGGGGAPGGGGGGGGAVRAGGGGSSAPSGGGGASSGGGRAVSSPGSSSSGGSRATYGGSSSGSSGYTGGSAVQRGGNSGYSSPTNGSNPAVRQVYGAPGDNAVPRGARPYGGATPYTGSIIGHAVPRQAGSTNRAGRPVYSGGGGHDINWGYAPWLFAGLGFYDVLYADPYWLAGYWFPYTYGYDYDPNWDPAAEAAQGGYGYEEAGMGGLKLKVQPSSAEVRVDGYYMGTVDDFNGVFQKMELAAGPHHVDIIAPGYRSIGFDVRIEPNDVVTYRGELQPLAKQQ